MSTATALPRTTTAFPPARTTYLSSRPAPQPKRPPRRSARAAALVGACRRPGGALLATAGGTRRHRPARAHRGTGLDDTIAGARGAGAFGAALSGAGPAVVAFAPARLAVRVVAAMEEAAH